MPLFSFCRELPGVRVDLPSQRGFVPCGFDPPKNGFFFKPAGRDGGDARAAKG